ncbi:MarR family winged helix-turn-helix transcriptional regulator [Glycomyces tarimensis]
MNDPETVADRLAEVCDLVGPLYRLSYRKVELDLEPEGVSVGVRAVLVMLHARGPMTVPQMGRAQALSRQFVQRMVNEAARRHLVEAIPNPAHKRSSLIRLTDEGRALVGTVHDREREALSRLGEDLTEPEIETCVKVLAHLVRGLGDIEVD